MSPGQRALALDVAHTVRNATWHPGESTEGVPPGSFTMQRETYPCGTPACLTGWTVRRAYALGICDHDVGTSHYHQDKARRLLGLDEEQGRDLFMPTPYTAADPAAGWEGCRYQAKPGEEGFITPEHAAACLEHLAQTGVVDWHGTKPQEESNP